MSPAPNKKFAGGLGPDIDVDAFKSFHTPDAFFVQLIPKIFFERLMGREYFHTECEIPYFPDGAGFF